MCLAGAATAAALSNGGVRLCCKQRPDNYVDGHDARLHRSSRNSSDVILPSGEEIDHATPDEHRISKVRRSEVKVTRKLLCNAVLSVRPSVRLSVCLSVTLVYCIARKSLNSRVTLNSFLQYQ